MMVITAISAMKYTSENIFLIKDYRQKPKQLHYRFLTQILVGVQACFLIFLI